MARSSVVSLVALCMGVLAISACSDVGAGVANDDGGGDGDGGLGPGDGGEGIRNADASSSTYAIGGSVAGLAGTGLVLTNSGKNDVAVAAGATSYAFTTKVPTATPYAVAVKSQPTSPRRHASSRMGRARSRTPTSRTPT